MTAIDLRSDTVTKPSSGMRRAMAEAEVGDDVLDGDPTTRRLEARVAELLGMEDALFFPSGTQANQTGVALLTAALVGGALRPTSPHVPCASAVAAENTHNAAGGKVMGVDVMAGIVVAAGAAGLPLHLDGARLWNAAAALAVPISRLVAGAATVMVSFSKGLGCPVGSCLGLRAAERPRAWEIRKRLGGGMRQSGILAAAALWALDHNLTRLGEDHDKARRLADLLSDCPAVRPSVPETNIVMVDLLRERDTASAVVPKLAA